MSNPPNRGTLAVLLGLPLFLFIALAILFFSVMNQSKLSQLARERGGEPYPENEPGDVVETLHGVEVRDPYRWLEDIQSPKVRQWLDEQDELTQAFLETLVMREQLKKRFAQLFYVDAISPPVKRGGRWFYSRRHADKEKTIFYMREGEDGAERVLIDPNTLSEDGSISLGVRTPSWDGKKLAYTLKPNNADEATLYVMDVDSGETSEVDVIPGAKYASPSWTPDNTGFYYTWLPEVAPEQVADRPGMAEVRYHQLGTDPKQDRLVHPATGDARTFIGSSISRDGRWLVSGIYHGWSRNDLYYKDLEAAPEDEQDWKPLVKDIDSEFGYEIWDNRLYLLTDLDAPRFRLLKASMENPARENWQEVVPESQDGAVLQRAEIIGNHLVLLWLKNASNQLEIRTLDGEPVRSVDLPEIGSIGGIAGDPDAPTLYYRFSSFTVPPVIIRTSVEEDKQEAWAKVDVPVDPSPYVTELVWFESKDGTKVSMFIVRSRNFEPNGRTPTYLYGYGGFSVTMEPHFMASIYPWLENGGVFAVPHLRGGGEYGDKWHEDGMLHQKQNTFDDFIAAAQYLIDNGYTSQNLLAIRGGSNGGLLVGAAITQRPDLFQAAIISVPLLDMVRYHKFGSGKTWVGEYGDPDKAEDFAVLHAYSPYHRVQQGEKYPATLLLCSVEDDRVDPMHARKMTAALQDANASPYPILLRLERQAGHGGADTVKSAIDTSADAMAFMMVHLNMKLQRKY